MRSTLAFISFACLIVTGCSSSVKTQYYTLQGPPSSAARSGVADSALPDIVIAQIALPEAVDRTQIVVRTGDNTLDINDAQRWADPLKSGIARVLAANLAQLLDNRVTATETGGAHDIRVNVEILSFESALGKSATIEAQWTITPGDSGKPLRGRSLAHESLAGNDYSSLAAGHSRALAQISREIAEAMRGMERK